MADQKTEKPTQKRLQKARTEGRFLQAREFITGVQLVLVLSLLSGWGLIWFQNLQLEFQRCLRLAFRSTLDVGDVFALTRQAGVAAFSPLALGGLVLLGATLTLHLSLTRFGFSIESLVPRAERLNSLSRLKSMPRDNLFSAAYAVVLFAVTALLVYFVLARQFPDLMLMARLPVRPAIEQIFSVAADLVWKLTAVFMCIGVVDLFRRYCEHNQTLRMTRQEVRDELRNSEGRPEVRQRIRSLQRGLLRRQMMRAVPTATVVLMNPTHYAVAIRYDMGSMAAPVLVAKGKNFLAKRIRLKAIEHGVPVVENPMLARAMYKSVHVGQEIPAQLYRAVAEVLAYVFGLLERKLPN